MTVTLEVLSRFLPLLLGILAGAVSISASNVLSRSVRQREGAAGQAVRGKGSKDVTRHFEIGLNNRKITIETVGLGKEAQDEIERVAGKAIK